ncbi:MAG: class I SAM-dependent methyltransferase, partial [bacterium]|nr:class I SAM-dependent methyltransferase [bacterium]
MLKTRLMGMGMFVCLLAACWASGNVAADEATARTILSDTGVQGGLVVHVGCGDGKLTAALHQGDSFLVHGLDRDAANVATAREHIQSKGLCGPVTVASFDGGRLPYRNNMVRLLVAEDLGDVLMSEVTRVLCPGGVAHIGTGEAAKLTHKPVPAELDEWTHALHGPDNNAVAHDFVVGPPEHLQWIGGPRWARSHDHLSSASAVVSSGGRVFAIVDEGATAAVALPAQWRLVAWDAFSGVVLWKQDIGP